MLRRHFLALGAGSAVVLAAFAVGRVQRASAVGGAQDGGFEIVRSEAEWRRLLSEEQFLVLRLEETEAPHSSPLNTEHRQGLFHCAGCDLPLYSSEAKYDSGTGWPSFSQSLPGAIGTKQDHSYFSVRTEAHCRRCGGHLGHIFDDGPAPTGQRHCLNGTALTFIPA